MASLRFAPAARAGVHGGDQLKIGGEGERAAGARDGDDVVFERLAHDFQGSLGELGEFIEKQHAAVGQADFARARHVAAADEARVVRICMIDHPPTITRWFCPCSRAGAPR